MSMCVCVCVCDSREWSVKSAQCAESELELEFECEMMMAISYAINNVVLFHCFSLPSSPLSLFSCSFFCVCFCSPFLLFLVANFKLFAHFSDICEKVLAN